MRSRCREAKLNGLREGRQSVLTELSAGFLGHLCHVGELCKVPGLLACGYSRLNTYRLKGLPHTPSPFSCPLNLLPLCIFKPSETLTAPPSPLPTGAGAGAGASSVQPLRASSASSRGRGHTTNPWDPEGQRTNRRLWEPSPLGWGPQRTCQQLSGAWLTGCQARRQAQGWVVYTEAQYLGDGLAVIEKRVLDMGLGHPGPNSTSDWLLCHCVITGEMIHLLELCHFPLGERVSSW